MNPIDLVLEDFYQVCLNRGYFVLPQDKEVLIYNKDEVVTLELNYDSEQKLNINFYKSNNDATFVNELMRTFTELVEQERICN